MPISEQDRIIGPHGNLKSIYKYWLLCTDIPSTPTQRIRYLEEDPAHRSAFIKQCAWWVVMRHVGAKNWRFLKNKRKTLNATAFARYIAIKHYLPVNDLTRKGNLGEILLCEYIQEVAHYTAYVTKLTYNPNVEQSMKGDDVLMFNPADIGKDLIYAESKIRQSPSSTVVKQIVNNLTGNKRFPSSINFAIQILRDKGLDELANAVDALQTDIAEGKASIKNLGWLISSRSADPAYDTLIKVKNNLNVSSNPNLAFVAVGIDDVQQFVDDVYQQANTILLTGKI